MNELYVSEIQPASANITLAFPNRIDEATLQDGTWQTTLPLANLQSRVLSRVARTAHSMALPATIGLDFGRPVRLGCVALLAHNASVSAIWRILANDDAYSWGGALTYDSGDLSAWLGNAIPLALRNWEDDNFWLGTLSADARAGYRAPSVHLLNQQTVARYWRIQVTDPSNADGYLQFGRLFAGDVWQPRTNYSFGTQFGFEDPSNVTESLGGVDFVEIRERYRTRRLELKQMSDSEAWGQVMELQRLCGRGGEILVLPTPADTASLPLRALYARLDRVSPIEHAYVNDHRVTLDLKELL